MRVTVFGATGVVGRALVPLLAGEHDVVAVSRQPGETQAGIRWVEADAISGEGVGEALDEADVAYYLVHSLGAGTSSGRIVRRQKTSHERRRKQECSKSSISAASEETAATLRRTCVAGKRRASASAQTGCR